MHVCLSLYIYLYIYQMESVNLTTKSAQHTCADDCYYCCTKTWVWTFSTIICIYTYNIYIYICIYVYMYIHIYMHKKIREEREGRRERREYIYALPISWNHPTPEIFMNGSNNWGVDKTDHWGTNEMGDQWEQDRKGKTGGPMSQWELYNQEYIGGPMRWGTNENCITRVTLGDQCDGGPMRTG